MARSKNTPIGIGIVGVSGGKDFRNAGWANVAHLPALQALDAFTIRGIYSRNPDSAVSAATSFNVDRTYGSIEDMAAASDIDLIAITVSVPSHYDLVRTSLENDKAVFCEWPLAIDLFEAEELVSLANRKSLRCGIGLQARAAPVVRYLRHLIRQGFVGEVLSTTIVGTGMNWGPGMPIRNDYTLDKKNGATLLSIPVGHALDALQHCLGKITEIQAMSALRRSQIPFPDDAVVLTSNAEDQWVIAARLESGAIASIHFRGGDVAGDNLRWEINGTDGDLVVSSYFGNIQPFDLRLAGAKRGKDLEAMEVPKKYYITPSLENPALNVAQNYALFASENPEAATFQDALALHRLLDIVERSSKVGCIASFVGASQEWRISV